MYKGSGGWNASTGVWVTSHSWGIVGEMVKSRKVYIRTKGNAEVDKSHGLCSFIFSYVDNQWGYLAQNQDAAETNVTERNRITRKLCSLPRSKSPKREDKERGA